ncbi:pyruvate carboxylase subunit B, partial [bacterium]|nr:pyruvate carboxylase subunit B [bacterium]
MATKPTGKAKAAKPARAAKATAAKGPAAVRITDTTLRDGHQSLVATRMRTEDMLEAAAMLDEIGFHSLEVWGGATFDVMHRYLQENPFDRLRELKKVAPKTPFQMLLRGQNLVGYRNYADDLVKRFVEHSAEVGVDIFRVFDALNDPRNLEVAGKTVKKVGKHFQATICYTITERRIGGPVFNEAYYIDKAKQMLALGADSICIKDMAGMINPADAELLVRLVKKHTNLPVQIHTHFTSGMGALAYLRATEAGVDVFDCAVAPFAQRTSQPAVEPLIVALEGHERAPGLDLVKIAEIGKVLEAIWPKYRHFSDTSKSSTIDTGVLIHQIPGGMYSNMVNQLKQADSLHRLHEVYEELPRARKELGYPPLVTPTSQIVGTQAVMNVLMGRYKMVSSEVKDLCYGLYGKTPAPVDPAVRKVCLKGYPRGEKPITGRPGDHLEPELPAATRHVEKLFKEAGKGEKPMLDDILIYGLYPRTGEAFLRWRLGTSDQMPGEKKRSLDDVKREDETIKKALAGELVAGGTRSAGLGAGARTFRVAVDGEVFDVAVEGEGMPVVTSASSAPRTAPAKSTAAAPQTVAAPAAGVTPLASG